MEILEGRTTALGLYNYAGSYVEAARTVAAAHLKSTHPDAPIRFLYYHAIELFLKAFLILRGQTVDQMKRHGHKVSKLRRACLSLGLAFDDEDCEVIDLIGDGDTAIRARYISSGYFSWPTTEALERTAASLRGRVRTALKDVGWSVR